MALVVTGLILSVPAPAQGLYVRDGGSGVGLAGGVNLFRGGMATTGSLGFVRSGLLEGAVAYGHAFNTSRSDVDLVAVRLGGYPLHRDGTRVYVGGEAARALGDSDLSGLGVTIGVGRQVRTGSRLWFLPSGSLSFFSPSGDEGARFGAEAVAEAVLEAAGGRLHLTGGPSVYLTTDAAAFGVRLGVVLE